MSNTPTFTQASRAAAQATRTKRRTHTPQELIQDAGLCLSPSREAQVAKRLLEMPSSYKGAYLSAVRGSRPAGVKAFCAECCGWDRKSVEMCTDEGCPLWAIRPYQE